MELNLEVGRVRIFGLTLAKPPAFKGPTALTLGKIAIDIDLESLQDQNLVVLDEIRIESPIVFYELNAAEKTDLDILQENAARRAIQTRVAATAETQERRCGRAFNNSGLRTGELKPIRPLLLDLILQS